MYKIVMNGNYFLGWFPHLALINQNGVRHQNLWIQNGGIYLCIFSLEQKRIDHILPAPFNPLSTDALPKAGGKGFSAKPSSMDLSAEQTTSPPLTPTSCPSTLNAALQCPLLRIFFMIWSSKTPRRSPADLLKGSSGKKFSHRKL